MKPVSKDVKDLLVKDRENGIKYKDLATKYKISINGARKIFNFYKKRNSNERLKRLCGRKSKASSQDDHYIAVAAKRDPFTSTRKIKEELKSGISTRTIQRRLNQSGLKTLLRRRKS